MTSQGKFARWLVNLTGRCGSSLSPLPRDVKRQLTDPNVWLSVTPSAALEMIHFLSENRERVPGLAAAVSPALSTFLPSISHDEALRLKFSLEKMKIQLPQDLLDALCNVRAFSENIDEVVWKIYRGTGEHDLSREFVAFAEGSSAALSFESCMILTHTTFSDLHSASPLHLTHTVYCSWVMPTLTRHLKHIDARNVLPSSHFALLFESACEVQCDPRAGDFRNATLQAFHSQMPHMRIEELVAGVEMLTKNFVHNETPIVVLKEVFERIEELLEISPSCETSVLKQLITLPHRKQTARAILRIFASNPSVRIADLEDKQPILFLHFCVDCLDVFCHDVEERIRVCKLVDEVCARLYLDAASFDCGECCDLLEDFECLGELFGHYVPSNIVEKVKARFFAAFREVSIDAGSTNPLTYLKRFLSFCNKCVLAPFVKSDATALIVLQKECVGCNWRRGPLLLSVVATLKDLEALYYPFGVFPAVDEGS